ncbi:hypothetical protein CHELA40_10314 [Chelatococcus asaccharovorans]|nr:hypothetical protein CHELA40_10314 [Chelatococcus asaccharovorans]CAH1686817.1 hypothetical protein CHELA17_65294 [Chelatococcus asaccharovorans]
MPRRQDGWRRTEGAHRAAAAHEGLQCRRHQTGADRRKAQGVHEHLPERLRSLTALHGLLGIRKGPDADTWLGHNNRLAITTAWRKKKRLAQKNRLARELRRNAKGRLQPLPAQPQPTRASQAVGIESKGAESKGADGKGIERDRRWSAQNGPSLRI